MRTFTPKNWDKHPYYRGYMIDDLEKKYDIQNMKKEEVLNLLGKNYADISRDTILYETFSGFLRDGIYGIVFDKNGKVIYHGMGN